jgi:hypothetical protein
MNNKTVVILGVFVGLLLFVATILFLGGEEEPAPVQESLPVSEVRPPAPVPVELPPTVVTPVVEEPVVLPEPEPVVVIEEPLSEPDPLPGLNDSDRFVQAELGELDNANAVLRQLAGAQIIRKFVVLVDGISRGDVPDRDLPVTALQTEMTVNEQGENSFRLDPVSYNRFNLLVNTFAAIDSSTIVEKLEEWDPLFEAAWAELGYPDRTFDMALNQAIRNVLQARIVTNEILLTRPSVHYHFADPALENLSDLEKLLIRMGPENASTVQRKVRDISNRLAN